MSFAPFPVALAPRPGGRWIALAFFSSLLFAQLVLAGCDRAPTPERPKGRVAHGVVTPQIIEIRGTLTGTLAQTLAGAGDQIAAGQELMVLEKEEIVHRLQFLRDKRAELERMIATAASGKPRVRVQAVRNPSPPSPDLQAQGEMERRLADLEFLQREGAATRGEVEKLRREMTAARTEPAAPGDRTLVVNDPGAQNFRDQLILQLDDVEGEIITLLQQQEKLRVRSPAAGTLVAVDLHPGEEVFPGERLASLALAAPPTVTAFARADQVASLRVGQELAARLASGKQTRLQVTRLFAPAAGQDEAMVAFTCVFPAGAALPENPLGSAVTIDLAD